MRVLIVIVTLACIAIAYGNSTGFCYAERRFLSEKEILLEALVSSESEQILRRAGYESFPSGHASIDFLLALPSTRAKLAGRKLEQAWLFQRPGDNKHLPAQIWRLLGYYRQLAMIATESSLDNGKYLIWARAVDECGNRRGKSWYQRDALDGDWWILQREK